MEIAVVLIVLHGPAGNDILLNPASITSMHAAIPGKKNEYVADAANCVVSMSDGKFISVVESCDTVKTMVIRGASK